MGSQTHPRAHIHIHTPPMCTLCDIYASLSLSLSHSLTHHISTGLQSVHVHRQVYRQSLPPEVCVGDWLDHTRTSRAYERPQPSHCHGAHHNQSQQTTSTLSKLGPVLSANHQHNDKFIVACRTVRVNVNNANQAVLSRAPQTYTMHSLPSGCQVGNQRQMQLPRAIACQVSIESSQVASSELLRTLIVADSQKNMLPMRQVVVRASAMHRVPWRRHGSSSCANDALALEPVGDEHRSFALHQNVNTLDPVRNSQRSLQNFNCVIICALFHSIFYIGV